MAAQKEGMWVMRTRLFCVSALVAALIACGGNKETGGAGQDQSNSPAAQGGGSILGGGKQSKPIFGNPPQKEAGGSGSQSSSVDLTSDNPNAELCKKYSECGCQSYEDCLRGAAKSPVLNQPGVRECMLISSCASLCAGRPDACIGTSSGGGAGTPRRSNCSAISCSKNSDCPADCYGGCDGVRCYSF